jgi:hypothetical protein
MLHEGASVEGEMHMLTEAPKDASETIRGSAPLRGDTSSTAGGTGEPKPATPAAPAAATPSAGPSSSARPASAVGGTPTKADTAPRPGADALRSSVVETLRTENARVVTPRATTTTRGYGYSGSPGTSDKTARDRSGSSTSGF